MQILLLAFLTTNTIFFNQIPRTVQQVLGKDKAQSIIMKAVSDSVDQASITYLVTEKSIEELRTAGVPQNVLYNLQGKFIDGKVWLIDGEIVVDKEISLVDKEVEGKKEFLQAIKRAIGGEQTRRYGDAILAHTQGYLIIDKDFEDEVIRRVLRTEVPDKDVRKWLERNFRKFLSGYVSFLKSKSEIRNRLTSHEYRLAEFLTSAKCGELECTGVPPCCGKLCDPCKN